jgi:alpha-ketoglutarate-dependent taurine dioxygenase
MVDASTSWTDDTLEDRFEPTPDQQSLFLGYARNPIAGSYVESLALRLVGALDTDALERAVCAVADRHGPLRSTFHLAAGRLEQRVHRSVLPFTIADEFNGSLSSWLTHIAGDPFDLERGPVARTGLYRLGTDDHVFCAAAHHIVCDGWSRGIFLRELGLAYESLLNGRGTGLSLPERGFADFARSSFNTEDPRRIATLKFWQSELQDVKEAPQRPLGGTLLPGSPAFDCITVDWSRLAPSLTRLAASQYCSPFIAFLAVLQDALFEETGAVETTIGIDFAGRTEPWMEGLIGFFARQIPIRLKKGHCPFEQSLKNLRTTVNSALSHANLSFNEIAAISPVEELFAIKLSLEQNMTPAVRLAGLTVEPLETSIAGAKFPLLLNISLSSGLLTCRAEFDPKRAPRERVERLLDRYRDVAECVTGSALPPGPRFIRRLVMVNRLIEDSEPKIPSPVATLRVVGSTNLSNHATQLQEMLRRTGAVLVRGLPPMNPQAFAAEVETVIGPLVPYVERSSPRTSLGNQIYTSTDYPSSRPIPLHNENAYASRWPRWIAFLCVEPPSTGGRTPLSDSRAVLAVLPTTVREAFERRGLQYIRRFSRPMGQTAQEVFGFEGAALEALLVESGYRVERDVDGHLITMRNGPALRSHPETNELVWFNHAHFFHPTVVASEWLSPAIAQTLPFDVLYGDGEVIDIAAIRAVEAAYWQTRIAFSWQSGDLLMLDNMMFAHGREPFTGSRQIWVAMGQELSDGN